MRPVWPWPLPPASLAEDRAQPLFTQTERHGAPQAVALDAGSVGQLPDHHGAAPEAGTAFAVAVVHALALDLVAVVATRPAALLGEHRAAAAIHPHHAVARAPVLAFVAGAVGQFANHHGAAAEPGAALAVAVVHALALDLVRLPP